MTDPNTVVETQTDNAAPIDSQTPNPIASDPQPVDCSQQESPENSKVRIRLAFSSADIVIDAMSISEKVEFVKPLLFSIADDAAFRQRHLVSTIHRLASEIR